MHIFNGHGWEFYAEDTSTNNTLSDILSDTSINRRLFAGCFINIENVCQILSGVLMNAQSAFEMSVN